MTETTTSRKKEKNIGARISEKEYTDLTFYVKERDISNLSISA